MEAQREPSVRREAVALIEDLLPAQLAMGGFRAVARILRELRVIAARAPGLDQELHTAVMSFEERLSRPEILEQLFRALEDATSRPADEDISEVMRELKPTALPAVLAHLGRTLDPAVRRALEPSVESLARAAPQALVEVFDAGPPEAIEPAIGLAARLGLQQLVPAITRHAADGDVSVRHAAVRALAGFGTPTAIAAVEAAVGDDDRTVRQVALSLLVERGGSGGLVRRLESLLFDDADRAWDPAPARSLYEAYGTLAGDQALPRLREILEPKGSSGGGRTPMSGPARSSARPGRSFDARLVVDGYTTDRSRWCAAPPTASSGLDAVTSSAAEDGVLRQAGRSLLVAIHGAQRALKLYPLENAAVQRALDS